MNQREFVLVALSIFFATVLGVCVVTTSALPLILLLWTKEFLELLKKYKDATNATN